MEDLERLQNYFAQQVRLTIQERKEATSKTKWSLINAKVEAYNDALEVVNNLIRANNKPVT